MTTTTPAANYADGGTVTVRLAADWTNFDVQKLPSLGNVQLVLPAYDRLVTYDGKTQVPYLAESWTVTPTTVTFKLKSGPTCADGTPVTATVVANSFKRLLDPATKFSNRAQLFGNGQITITPDDAAKTVTFASDVPFSNMIYSFADPSASIICPAGLANPALIETQMFGSGPYKLESATHNDQVVFKLRSDWTWGPYGTNSKTPGMPATIIYKIVADEATAANLLLTGGLTLSSVNGPDVPRLIADKSLLNQQAPLTTSALMVFNERPNQITQDQTIRQALQAAIDPASWRQTANGGFGVASQSYLAPGIACYDADTGKKLPKPSVQTAKDILTAGGWKLENGVMTKDGKPLNITVLGNITQNTGPDYLAATFKEVGVNVTLAKVDFATYAANLNSASFSWQVTVAQLSALNAFAALPSTFAVPFMSGKSVADGGRNLYNIQDADIEANVSAGLAATGDASCQAWAKVQQRYLARYDFLPLGVPVDNWFGKKVEFKVSPIEPVTWRVLK